MSALGRYRAWENYLPDKIEQPIAHMHKGLNHNGFFSPSEDVVFLTAKHNGVFYPCQPHDIPALMAARLLKPLGNPAPNSIKFFATADLLEVAKDHNWLVRVTSTINQHWH